MGQPRIVIDGYNLIHKMPELARLVGTDLERARDNELPGMSSQVHQAATDNLAALAPYGILPAIVNALKTLPKLTIESQTDKTLVLSLSNGTAVSDIVSFLSERGVRIEQVRHAEASLEDIYASILKGDERR